MAGNRRAERDSTSCPRRTTIYCLKCLYPLDGLTATKCPECGGAFDLTDVTSYTYQTKRQRARALLTLPMVLVLLHSFAMGLAAIPWFATDYEFEELTFFLAIPMAVMDYPILILPLPIIGFGPVTRYFLLFVLGGVVWFGVGLGASLCFRGLSDRNLRRRQRQRTGTI